MTSNSLNEEPTDYGLNHLVTEGSKSVTDFSEQFDTLVEKQNEETSLELRLEIGR